MPSPVAFWRFKVRPADNELLGYRDRGIVAVVKRDVEDVLGCDIGYPALGVDETRGRGVCERGCMIFDPLHKLHPRVGVPGKLRSAARRDR